MAVGAFRNFFELSSERWVISNISNNCVVSFQRSPSSLNFVVEGHEHIRSITFRFHYSISKLYRFSFTYYRHHLLAHAASIKTYLEAMLPCKNCQRKLGANVNPWQPLWVKATAWKICRVSIFIELHHRCSCSKKNPRPWQCIFLGFRECLVNILRVSDVC